MRLIKYILAVVALLVTIPIAAIFLLPPEEIEFVNQDLVLENPLAIPSELHARIENGEKVFDLTVATGETGFFAGKRTRTLGFNGGYLGPTLRARKGDAVRINVANTLDEATTTHWHGMHLPPVMDGGPHQLIAPGDTWHPYWTISNEATTLWYHPHIEGKTGEQVYRGLAGLFIIDDDNADSLALPKDYGVDDIPLVVQDRKFDAGGQLV